METIAKVDTSSVGGAVIQVLGWLAFGFVVCIGWQLALKVWGAF